MTLEKDSSNLLKYLNAYKVHYMIGALVYLSFAISGFQFDIERSSTLTRLVYGLLQVFTLVGFLSLAKNLILKLYPREKNSIKTHILVILLGTLASFLFDSVLIEIFEIIDPNCKFQSSGALTGGLIVSLKHYTMSFLADLKYPVVFWPLCELADNYLLKLTQTVGNPSKKAETPIESISFLKSIPVALRKDLLAIEAQQNYILLIFPEKNYTVLYRLKDALEQLPNDLGMKVHRSYWVAFEGIDKIKDSRTLVLKTGREIPISRTFSKELRLKMHN